MAGDIRVGASAVNLKCDEKMVIAGSLEVQYTEEQANSSPPLRGPQAPDAERESFQLADSDLTIELVAAEPDIVSPVAIAWDPDGKLYVAEMIGYPNKEGLCRVAVLQDPDGDGRYQRTSTFADNLSFVTSVMPYRGGLLVTSAPDLLFLKDTDADGIADVRQVEFTGFGTGSQQLRANSLHFGLDNWIYGANGRCDGEIIRPGQSAAAVSLRTRDFRFDATMNDFQSIVGQSQFGQVHNNWGERFLSWNVIPVRHVLIEDRYLAHAPHKIAEAVIDIADPADTKQVFPISPPPRQFNSEQANYYNAMCGLSIYRGDRLGSAYAGNAFVGESLSNLVTRRVLEPNGPTFTARRVEQGKEFLASRDSWFHPVNIANGPDGSLYVVDFYRVFVEHPIYVANLKARAETNWREGAEHGRLWRIRKNDVPWVVRQPKLNSADNAELVRTLEHPVGWWRDTAQRLLFDRNQQRPVPELSALLSSSRNSIAKLHALWAHSNLSSLATSDLIALLKDENPLLRRHAILRAELKPQSDSREVWTTLLAMADDPDSRVRFQVGLTLGRFNDRLDPNDLTDAFVKLIGDGEDRWMALAVSCGAAQAAVPVLDRLLARPEWLETPSASRTRFLEETAAQVRAEGNVLPASMTRQLSPAAKRLAPGEISVLAGITKRAVTSGLAPAAQLLPLIRVAVEAAADEALPVATRIQAVEILARHQPENAEQVLIRLLQPAQPAVMQVAAARATADLRDQQQFAAIYSEWNQLGTQARLEILQNSSRSATATAAVLTAVEQGLVNVREIPSATAIALTQVRDVGLKDRVHKLLASVLTSNRGSIIERYSSVVTMRGDVQRGAQYFKQQCLVCHSIQGFGNRVGPDLSGVGGRRNDMLLIDILDPSRVVAPDFISYVAATKQGQVVTGLIAAESPASLTFKRADGKSETIERANIDELRSTGKSLMPDGLEEKLSPMQLVDVLEFLRKPDRELLK